MAICIDFPYEGLDAVQIPLDYHVTIIEPNTVPKHFSESIKLINNCIENPIGTKRLREEVSGCKNVLILADDYTRLTPTNLVLPAIIKELVAGGVALQHITVMVASGTHRAMTPAEKLRKYGTAVLDSVTVVDHVWYDESQLTNLGSTEQGTEILLNSLVLKSDYVLGVGHIVPHRVAGFSGGAKIVQPGVCGEITTGQTHWLSAKSFVGKDIMGIMDNPVRKEINEVGRRAGLKFIFNTIQDGNGDLYACFCGDPEEAFAVGCGVSLSVFGCHISELADIVISDAYPSHINMWQAAKGVFSGDLALKEDGILILVASCTEGIANEHPQVEAYGYADPDLVQAMVESGEITDLTIAAHILHIGRVITGKRKAYLVSTGLSKERTEHIGFLWAGSVQEALDLALLEKGSDATISVIKHAGEVMPIL